MGTSVWCVHPLILNLKKGRKKYTLFVDETFEQAQRQSASFGFVCCDDRGELEVVAYERYMFRLRQLTKNRGPNEYRISIKEKSDTHPFHEGDQSRRFSRHACFVDENDGKVGDLKCSTCRCDTRRAHLFNFVSYCSLLEPEGGEGKTHYFSLADDVMQHCPFKGIYFPM